jgi:hypothetical protein
MVLPTEGDFSFINDEFMAQVLTNMYNAVTELNLWESFNEEPPADKGYMFWEADFINQISKHASVASDEHSGSSLSHCLRHMRDIKKCGWDGYVTKHLRSIKRRSQDKQIDVVIDDKFVNSL